MSEERQTALEVRVASLEKDLGDLRVTILGLIKDLSDMDMLAFSASLGTQAREFKEAREAMDGFMDLRKQVLDKIGEQDE